MEIRFRIEKVENGVIFTTPNGGRFVSPEISPAIDEISKCIASELDEKRECAIVVLTPEHDPRPIPRNGCDSKGFYHE